MGERGILVTYNDNAGSGKAGDLAAKAAKRLSDIRYPFDLRAFSDLTHHPELIEGCEVACVFGGDGTVYSVARIIGESTRRPTLMPIPAGTENVLAKAIHGTNIKPLELMDKTVAFLSGEDSLHKLQLQAGEYRLDRSTPNNFYWLLTAGDSGLTRRTLAALDKRGPTSKLSKNMTALRAALNRVKIDNTVLVTVFDENGEIFDEFDALEASVIKKTPGKWSRVQIVPKGDMSDQVFTVGRGYTDYNSRRLVYRTLFDSLAAVARANVQVFDHEKNKNASLTRLSLKSNHTVVFRARGENYFGGTVTDSEVLKTNAERVVIKPNSSGPIVEVFLVLNPENG